jgi:hypothetical protein
LKSLLSLGPLDLRISSAISFEQIKLRLENRKKYNEAYSTYEVYRDYYQHQKDNYIQNLDSRDTLDDRGIVVSAHIDEFDFESIKKELVDQNDYVKFFDDQNKKINDIITCINAEEDLLKECKKDCEKEEKENQYTTYEEREEELEEKEKETSKEKD